MSGSRTGDPNPLFRLQHAEPSQSNPALYRAEFTEFDIATLLPDSNQLPAGLRTDIQGKALQVSMTRRAWALLSRSAVPDDEPLVSVVMPNYNGSKYVSDAIASVLKQSWNSIHLVVVDDGSTDDSAAVIEKTLLRFPESSSVLVQLPHVGSPAVARNAGLFSFCPDATEFYSFLDSDDLYVVPDAIRSLANVLNQHSDAIAAYGDYDWITPSGEPLKPPWGLRRQRDGSFKQRSDSRLTWLNLATARLGMFHLQCLMIRRGVPFLPYQTYGEDGRYFQELFRICSRNEERGLSLIQQVPEIIAHYRRHAESLSSAHRAPEIKDRSRQRERREERKGVPEFHINAGVPKSFLTQSNLNEFLLRKRIRALVREYRKTRRVPWASLFSLLRSKRVRLIDFIRIGWVQLNR